MTLGVASFVWLWWRANLLAGFLVVLTIAFYVLVYTMVLKRRTWQNVIWGGAAGCIRSWSAGPRSPAHSAGSRWSCS